MKQPEPIALYFMLCEAIWDKIDVSQEKARLVNKLFCDCCGLLKTSIRGQSKFSVRRHEVNIVNLEAYFTLAGRQAKDERIFRAPQKMGAVCVCLDCNRSALLPWLIAFASNLPRVDADAFCPPHGCGCSVRS